MTTTHETTLPACSELRNEATRNEAFDRLVGVLLRPIYWHVRRLVVEHDEAEEITQETFVRAFEQFDRFRGGDGELRAWVYRIATNLSISALRRRRRSILTATNFFTEILIILISFFPFNHSVVYKLQAAAPIQIASASSSDFSNSKYFLT